MTNIFVNRSIPLSKESRDAWTNAGAVVLARRERVRDRQLALVPQGERLVVNLGIAPTVGGYSQYNSRDSVRSVLTPAALRKTLPELIPPEPDGEVLAWLKGPGQHGKNKYKVAFNGEGLEPGWDWQLHVEGSEYRVISVGRRVVQSHLKSNIEWTDGQHEADWEWAGVTAIKGTGIIGLVHKAVDLVPNGEHTVFGWDIILADKPYIIEANSSPGVNDATAGRIMKAIKDSL